MRSMHCRSKTPFRAKCRKLATAWGDNGAECPLPAILYGLQLYAEFTYTGDTSPSALASRFESCVGEPCEAFSRLGEFDLPALFAPVSDDPVNFSKFLLYQDPLLPLFQADCEGLALSGRYESLQRLYHGFTSQEPRFEAMYRFYEQLAGLLALKVQWFLQAPAARCQSPQAAQMAALAHACARQCESCRAAWGRLWEAVNKPFGYEVIDLGKDVPIETVVQAVVENHVVLAGLSALMTTTVENMAKTIEALHRDAPWCKIMVGGAVLTPEYAEMIHADYYSKDAMASVRYAEEIVGGNEQ